MPVLQGLRRREGRNPLRLLRVLLMMSEPYIASNVLTEIASECGRQDSKWGKQNHSPERWFAILGEEFGEVAREVTKWIPPRGRPPDAANYRYELIQLAAVAVRMIECFDRQATELAEFSRSV